MALASSFILPSLSNFDVHNTLPELQHDFLALWNKIEQAPNHEVITEIRENLLNVYNALTQGTVDVSATQPNFSDSTSPVHGAVDENDHTITSPLLSHHDTSLVMSPHWQNPPTLLIPASNLADDSPLGELTQRTTTAALTGPNPPLGIQGRPGTSQAVASSATTITDNIVNIP
ncbi:hypothetical protein BGW80DRAFT_1343849, partial [Lactifluus volemus]